MYPKVSIILPVYNAQDYLKDAIASVLEQTYQDFELLLINDESTDSSKEIIESYERVDPRVKAFTIEHSGPGGVRNFGLSVATGEWLQFVDADDIIEPEMLEYMYTEAQNYDLVTTGVIHEYVLENRVQTQVLDSHTSENRDDLGEYILSLDLIERDVVMNSLWNKLFRREIITKNQIRFDESMKQGEDFEFICQFLARAGSHKICNRAFYHWFHRNNGSVSKTFHRDELQRRERIYAAYLELLNSFDLIPKYKNSVELNEGRCAIGSINRISYPSCNLSAEEKKEYIEEFLNGHYYNFLCKYIASVPLRNRIKNYKLYDLIQKRDPEKLVRYIEQKGRKAR